MFNPTYTAFLDRGKPRAELYSVSDGLHLNGAGVDRLEAAISQALSTGYLLERVRSRRARRLSTILYWLNMADEILGYGPAGIWPLCGICRNFLVVIICSLSWVLPGGFLGVSGSVSVLVALLPGHYLNLNFVGIRGLRVIWRIGIV